MFVAQMGLITYYIFELEGWSDEDPDDNVGLKTHDYNNVSVVKWFIGVVIVEVAAENEVGAEFNFKFWYNLIKGALNEDSTIYKNWDRRKELKKEWCCKEEWCGKTYHVVEGVFRCLLAFLVNSVSRSVLLGTAPIMLCVEGPMDFIKDVMAVFFIVNLDDYGDTKEINDDELGEYRMMIDTPSDSPH